MARTKLVQQYINLPPTDVNRMTEAELRKAVQIMASTANKRLKRLEAQPMGENAPAYQSAQKRAYTGVSGGKFGTAGKNRNQLLNEYKAVKGFLEMKTGSVQKWNKYRKGVYERLGGGFSSADQEKQFWKNYRKLEELHPELKSAYGSTQTQSDLQKIMNEQNVSQFLNEINTYNKMLAEEGSIEDVEELTNNRYYINSKGKPIKFDPNDNDSILDLMSERLNIKYEQHQEEFNEDEEDFFEI